MVGRVTVSAKRRINPRVGQYPQSLARWRLLRAAVETVNLEGFARPSVHDICVRAGLDEETFFEHFPDSEECCAAAFRDASTRLRARVLEAISGRETWAAQIRAGTGALLSSLEDDPLVARFVLVESAEDPPAVRHCRAQTLKRVVQTMNRDREHPHPLIDPSPLAAERLVDFVRAFVVEALLSEHLPPLTQMSGALSSMIVLSYSGQR